MLRAKTITVDVRHGTILWNASIKEKLKNNQKEIKTEFLVCLFFFKWKKKKKSSRNIQQYLHFYPVKLFLLMYRRDLTTIHSHCCCPSLQCWHNNTHLTSEYPAIWSQAFTRHWPWSAELTCKSLLALFYMMKTAPPKKLIAFSPSSQISLYEDSKNTTFHLIYSLTHQLQDTAPCMILSNNFWGQDCQCLKTINVAL